MRKGLSRRTFLGGSALAGAGLLLAACGQAQMVEEAPAEEEMKEEPKEAAKEAEAMEAKVVNYLHVDLAQNEIWQNSWGSIFDKYKAKHPDLELTVTGTSFGELPAKAGAAQAGGIAFDAVYGYFAWLGPFIESEIITNIDPYLAADGDVSPDDFYDATKERYQGQTYGLAWFSNGKEIWFNKNLFTEAGLQNPTEMEADGAWTWEALLESAKLLTKVEGDEIVQGGVQLYAGFTSYLCMYAWAYGADFWDEGCTMPTFTSDSFRDAVQFHVDVALKHKVMGGSYIKGTQAMFNTGSFNVRTFEANITPEQLFEIGMAPMPSGPAGRPVALANNAMYLGGSGVNPDGGWEFLKHTVSADVVDEVGAMGGGRYVANKNITPATTTDYEDVNVYLMQAANSRITPTILKQADFNAAWSETWAELVEGSLTVPEALDRTQGQLENWLAEGGCIQ
ncbi:MAG: extracellular solute-binding protein [Chloroflexi bacterium]|nr:extracellular solute-binding protein [Chloroflexota bacterium]